MFEEEDEIQQIREIARNLYVAQIGLHTNLLNNP